MVSISFSEQKFIPLIREGIKDQTCRPLNPASNIYDRRSRIWQLANARKYELFFKMRNPRRKLIGEGLKKEFILVKFYPDHIKRAVILEAVDVKLKNEMVDAGYYVKTAEAEDIDHEDFAVRDGFKDFGEMLDFFRQKYTPEFTLNAVWMVPRWDFIQNSSIERTEAQVAISE